jgi:hypothetical protein
MQSPPGEDSVTGETYDLQTIKPLLDQAYEELVRARAGYERAERYAEGLSTEMFNDPRLRRMLGLDSVYAINMCTVVINAVSNRLNITGMSVEGDDAATKAVEALWKSNRLALEEGTLTQDALRYGDTLMIVWPGPDGKVRMIPNSPLTTRLFYDAEDLRTPTHAIKAWQSGPRTLRVDLYFPNLIYKFVSKNNGTVWEEVCEPDGAWPMVNPYGAIPVFHWRSGDKIPLRCTRTRRRLRPTGRARQGRDHDVRHDRLPRIPATLRATRARRRCRQCRVLGLRPGPA